MLHARETRGVLACFFVEAGLVFRVRDSGSHLAPELAEKLLREQVSAQADQAEFYEECIAEMAAIVYA